MREEELEISDDLFLKLDELIRSTDWNSFKTVDSFFPGIELKSMLINARRKVGELSESLRTSQQG